MLVLKLAYSEELDFVKQLQKLRDILKGKDITIGIVENIEGSTHIIKLICEDNDYSEELFNKINLYVSNILYKLVINQYREKEMFQFLTDTYFFLKQNEILKLEEKIMEVLNLEVRPEDDIFIYCYNKINIIIDKIQNCINENKEININGFITFRMRELREDVEDVVDKLVEKHIVEKEYEEFIRLLKYFVEIQDSKIDEVNISINSYGVYLIEDEKGEDIFNLFLKELSGSDLSIIDANVEDIVISGLIMNVPKKINIYGKENCKNKEFIKTIENVFGERVKLYNRIKSGKV